MNKALPTLAILSIALGLLPYNHVNAQCTSTTVGNPNSSGQWFINWRSQLIINETDTWTNTAPMPRYVDITDFDFHLGRTGNPITPFVVQVNLDNNFTVMAIGETRTTADYTVGSNSFPFSSSPTRILVAPGATIATGFIEAYPDGTGVTSRSMVTLTTNGDEVWFTGGNLANQSGSIAVGQPPMVGQIALTGLNWSYRFNITICPEDVSSYTGAPASSVFFNVNTTMDGPDANPGDGICAKADGLCSVRAAIEEGNAGSSPMTILFSATGGLQIDNLLPEVNRSILIDGFSAPDYQSIPTVQLRGSGFNMLTLRGIQEGTIQGIELSGLSAGGFDSYGISVYSSSNITIRENVIRNRARAVHANGVYDLIITDNDLRDCGDDFRDGAIFLRHVLEQDIVGGMKVFNNKYGGINTNPQSLFQVHYCRNVIVSDGTAPNTNIQMTNQEEFWYPIRFYKTLDAQVTGLDLSYQGNSLEGIGIRSLESNDIKIDNCIVHRRRTAIDVDGGGAITINNCDLSDSGLNTDQGTLTIRNFNASAISDLLVDETIFAEVDFPVDNYISLFSCDGIAITGLSNGGNIRLDGILSNYYPISMNLSTNITVQGLQFLYANQSYHQAKAIWLENGCTGINILENSFDGWAAAVHAESAIDTRFDCNRVTRNRNGLLVDNNSTFASLSDNNFGCNAIGIHQRGTSVIPTINNYWGDETGSSSTGGAGDWMIGTVDVNDFNIMQNTCAETFSASICAGEICNNGIDDDLDGLVDCDDGGCANDPNCAGGPIANYDAQQIGADDAGSQRFASTELQDLFTVYPNPSKGAFTLKCNFPCTQYSVFDVLGNEVRHGQLNELNNINIDLSAYQNGSYLVQVSSTDRIQVVRLIKH